MERLPEEIVANILSRVSVVKNLLQFRCVCKSWNSIISHPKFPISHFDHQSNNNHKQLILSDLWTLNSLSIYDHDDDDDDNNNSVFAVSELSFPVEQFANETIQILGCCHGLLCIGLGRDLVIWNPSIKQFKILPKFYDPCFVIGFGYDSFSDDYEIVRAIVPYGDKVEVELFSLKTNSWKDFEYPHYGFIYWQSRNLLNGSLHWLAWERLRSDGEPDIMVVAFSLAEEKFLEVPLPDVDDGCDIREMCVFDGFLCVSGINPVESGVDIWVMKEYMVRASWTKLCTILWETIPGCHAICLPICSLRDGDVLLEIEHRRLVKYNMNEKNYSTVTEVRDCSLYVESLVSPNFDDAQH